MAIKGNKSSGIIDATAADFTILQNTSSNRWAVTQIHLHADTAVGDTVELFSSPDATSAAGVRIDRVVMAGDDTQDALFVTTILEAGRFLVGNATAGALVNVEAIYTIYTGDS